MVTMCRDLGAMVIVFAFSMIVDSICELVENRPKLRLLYKILRVIYFICYFCSLPVALVAEWYSSYKVHKTNNEHYAEINKLTSEMDKKHDAILKENDLLRKQATDAYAQGHRNGYNAGFKAASNRTPAKPRIRESYQIETDDGFAVHVPEDKLDSWREAHRTDAPAELTEAEKRLKAMLLERIYGKKEPSPGGDANDHT